MIWLNQFIQGALLVGYYALIACGLSFMFSVMGVISVAHGSLAIRAAFALFALADTFGVNPFLGIFIWFPPWPYSGGLCRRWCFSAPLARGSWFPY